MELSSGHPEIWAHMPGGPFASVDNFRSEFINGFCAPVGVFSYAILDLTKSSQDGSEEDAFAGMISYMNSSPINLCTEIGAVVVLPPFQRTHVASNAVGLMIHHAFRSEAEGGLGLTRVVWQTSSANKGSAKVAERMGFKHEGTLKYDRRFKQGKLHSKVGNGRPLPPGSDENDLWRDTLVFGLCWDDWERGAREKVQAAMDRTK